ncbi:MAG: EAL domain-containing protein [Pseudomonadota bacterium]
MHLHQRSAFPDDDVVQQFATPASRNVIGKIATLVPATVETDLRFTAPKNNSWTRAEEKAVLEAIDEKCLRVSFQPIFGTNGKAIALTKFEAFSIWGNKETGLIAPERAFEIAERFGRTNVLSDMLLMETFRRCQDLPYHIAITFNLTEQQLLQPDLVSQVVRRASEMKFDLSRFVVEISEKIIADDMSAIRCRLHAFRNLGIQVALDDFGTCAAGISMLSALPLDIVKIDKSLLHGARDNDLQVSVLSSLVLLCGRLNMSTVIEGVECVKDFTIAKTCGFSEFQGFHFSRPLTIDRLEHSPVLRSIFV